MYMFSVCNSDIEIWCGCSSLIGHMREREREGERERQKKIERDRERMRNRETEERARQRDTRERESERAFETLQFRKAAHCGQPISENRYDKYIK